MKKSEFVIKLVSATVIRQRKYFLFDNLRKKGYYSFEHKNCDTMVKCYTIPTFDLTNLVFSFRGCK